MQIIITNSSSSHKTKHKFDRKSWKSGRACTVLFIFWFFIFIRKLHKAVVSARNRPWLLGPRRDKAAPTTKSGTSSTGEWREWEEKERERGGRYWSGEEVEELSWEYKIGRNNGPEEMAREAGNCVCSAADRSKSHLSVMVNGWPWLEGITCTPWGPPTNLNQPRPGARGPLTVSYLSFLSSLYSYI